MIKALFFDFDGVLTLDKTGSLTTTRSISTATGIDYARVKAAFAPYNDDLMRGRCTHAAVWAAICHDLAADIDIRLLEKAFASTPLNVEMLSLAERLRPAYIVGVITDNRCDRMDCIERLHRLSVLFHPIVVSAAVGSTKAERAIFEHALALAGVAPYECIFIDNTPRNLVVPREMGIDGIHFDDEANDIRRLISELRERDIAVGDAP
jgi:FMN phosphatase YigB (HAD superfamily)